MEILTLISNLLYLIGSIYLLNKNIFVEGILFFIIFIISHIYHLNINNNLWRNIDITAASIGFIYIFIRYHSKIFNKENIKYLLLLLLVYVVGFGCYYIDIYGHSIYCFIHSLWHIFSVFYILYIITL